LFTKPKEKYCLYLGRIIDNKGIDDLVNIFKDISGLKLYLAGSVDSTFDKEKYSNENVKYLGYLNKFLLEKYILNAEFIISPSKLPETFGLVALEANSFGKFFVGYDVGAYSEIIKNKQNGFLAKSDEELKTVIEMLTEKNYKIKDQGIIKQIVENRFNQKKYYFSLTKLFKSAIIDNQIKY